MKKLIVKILVSSYCLVTVLLVLSELVFRLISKVKNKDIRKYEEFGESEIENVYIDSRDEKLLHGTIIKADKPSKICVLIIHGIGGRSITQSEKVAKFYHDLGANVLLTDQRGYGYSKGEYTTYGALESKDHMLWLDFIEEEFGNDSKIVIHGISMGAATALMMCKNVLPRNVKGIVLDSSFSSAKEMLQNTFEKKKLPKRICYFLYQMACFNKSIYDPKRTNPIEGAENLNLPVIFAHTKDDSLVPFEMTRKMYEVCPSINKRLVEVPGDNHSYCMELSEEMRMLVEKMIKKLQ